MLPFNLATITIRLSGFAFTQQFARPIVAVGVSMLVLSGCTEAPMTRGGSLSSYKSMTPSDGVLTKSFVRISKDKVLAARTLRIVPTAFAKAASPTLSTAQRILVGNAVDRSVCLGLSDRFQIVLPNEPADLTVRAIVTHAAATDEIVAGASKIASVIPAVLSLGVPVPIPRIPIGLGSLTIEAEAMDNTNAQQAAMIWARGADSITTSPKISKVADAYTLATSFGADFSHLLVTGNSPFGKLPYAPPLEKIASAFEGKVTTACERFGRDPGIQGMVADVIGLPPEWSDDGATPANKP